MTKPVLQDIHSEAIFRRIAVIENKPVVIAVHAQDRMFDRLVDHHRSVESALERLDALLQYATFCPRRPDWAHGSDPEDTVIWIYLGRKVAMPCVLDNGVMLAATLFVRGKAGDRAESNARRSKLKRPRVEFPRINRMQDWLDDEGYDYE